MSRLRVDGIPVEAVVVLHAQVASRDSVALWQRVGTLRATEQELTVEWDEETGYLAALWRPGGRVRRARDAAGKTLRFGVFVDRRSVLVGETWVSADELWRLRRELQVRDDRPSPARGIGPRAPRSGWPGR